MERPRKKKLLDQVRDALRRKHYSYRTEESYILWIKRYIFFHLPAVRHGHKPHPKEMGSTEIKAFLTHLAAVRAFMAILVPIGTGCYGW